MKWVRTWLPAGIIVVGFVLAAVSGFSETGVEGGTLLVSAGLSVWLINLLYRIASASRAIASATRRIAPAPTTPSTAAGPTRSGAGMAAEAVDSGHGRGRRR